MQIDIEDFRIVTESYGMQLDDDIILATFSKVCHLATCWWACPATMQLQASPPQWTWPIHQTCLCYTCNSTYPLHDS